MLLSVQKRARLIRQAVSGETLERLYEQSNQNCDLCGFPIQDIMLAALDHSTPVIFFAKSDMPIEEAIAAANDPQNLRCAHFSCNSAKQDLTRDEWFARGLNDREAPRLLTEGQLLELQFRLGAGGRKGGLIGGRISGRKTQENRTGIFGMTPEQRSAACRKGGRNSGRKSVERGHIQELGRSGVGAYRLHELYPTLARQAGRKTKDMGIGIHAPGMAAIGGRKCAELKVGVCGRTPDQMTADGHKGGTTSGRLCADSGQLAINRRTALHVRWHVKLGIVKSDCSFCQKQQVVAA